MGRLQYYAHGKLLITGEYTVLDGALALAIPCKLGQSLNVKKSEILDGVQWKSWDIHQKKWLEISFDLDLNIISSSDIEVAKRLQSILKQAIELNSSFEEKLIHSLVETHLEFDRNWGLGSSSTLIQLISEWAEINPYQLLASTFKGSGYDIACASATQNITYQKRNSIPQTTPVDFNPGWLAHAYFIFLGEKQISRNEIKKYATLEFDRINLANQITKLTQEFLNCTDISTAQSIIETHEELLSKTLGYPTVKKQRFSNIQGSFKSLGAWGGDFVLYMGAEDQLPEIKRLGYSVIIPWKELALIS